MRPVAVRILHPAPGSGAGTLERALATARVANAERLEEHFRGAGAPDTAIVHGPASQTFGARLRSLIGGLDERGAGLVVLGSGSIPLATRRFVGELLAVAGSGERRALANSFYSADVVALGQAANLASVPDLPSDNALPRWLREVAGYDVADARGGWRLGVDLDSPLDVLLIGGLGTVGRPGPARLPGIETHTVEATMAALRTVASDPTAELLVAGRTNSASLRWLERRTASRTRALVEERGLRAIGLASQARGPRSALGLILDDRGPEALGTVLAELGDGGVVDTRVLMAHRLGPDESRWPAPEDRYASDLLLADRIRDSWLAAVTASARDSTIPIALGGHSLVGPGLRLLLGTRRGSQG